MRAFFIIALSFILIAGQAQAVTTISLNLDTDGNLVVDGNSTLGDAVTDLVTVNGTFQGAAPFVFEGAIADAFETGFVFADPTADRTITFPDATGEVSLLGQTITDAEVSDTITINAFGTVDDGALSGTVANLNAVETITADWVNTANPWADNEVDDALTVSGGTINNSVIGGVTPAAGTFTTLTANTSLTSLEDLVIGSGSGADNDSIFFDQSAESFVWDEAGQEFDLSDDLRISATDARLIIGTGGTNVGISLDHNGVGARQFDLLTTSGADPLFAGRFTIRDVTGGNVDRLIVDGNTGLVTVPGDLSVNGNATLGDAATDLLTVTAVLQGASPLVFEGATANDFETTFAFTDPTADRTITFPDITGTVVTTGDTGSVNATMLLDGICFDVLASDIDPTEVGGTNDYINLVDGTSSATETDEDLFNVPVAMNAVNLRAETDVAPGVGNDAWVVTVRDDAADTSLTCTIDEAATSCSDLANEPTISAGSRLTVEVDSSGVDADPAAASSLRVSFCLSP